jgi:hypothetical protein
MLVACLTQPHLGTQRFDFHVPVQQPPPCRILGIITPIANGHAKAAAPSLLLRSLRYIIQDVRT